MAGEHRLLELGEYKARKQQLKDQNVAVTTPIPRIDDDIIKRKTNQGRKRKYTPQRLKNEINRYFTWCEENDEIPSIKGLMIHCKMYKDSFYKYIKQPEYEDLLEHARLIIVNWAENDVYNTKGMAAGKIAYMKNVHSWADKLDTNNVTEQRVITVDEARSKIEMLAPKLLELIKDSLVVNQIAGPVVEAEVIK